MDAWVVAAVTYLAFVGVSLAIVYVFTRLVESSRTKPTPAQLARWARTRRLGRAKFVTLFGVIGFGVPIALLAGLISWGMVVVWSAGGLSFVQCLGLAAIPMCLVGAWFGSRLWHASETRYAAERGGEAA